MRSPTAKELRQRWIGEELRITLIITDIQNNVSTWPRHLLADPTGGMTHAIAFLGQRSRPQATGEPAPRDLRGIHLRNVVVTASEALADTDLDWAILEDMTIEGGSLTGASFRCAEFRGSCRLFEVKAMYSDFRDATCRGISLNGTDLSNANICGCDLRDADLQNTNLENADWDEEGAIDVVLVRKRWTKVGGNYQRMQHLNHKTDLRLRRYIAGSSAICDFRKKHPLLAFAWYVIANYGRSSGRLAVNTILCWLFYACCFIDRVFLVGGKPLHLTLSDALYLSVVTLTTLGFGDIVPRTDDWFARLLIGAEAGSGIVLMGALISIFMENARIRGD